MSNRTKELALIAIFPAMMAATAGVSIPMGSLPAITLQTLFVYLAGLMLRPRSAALSMLVYVLIGAIGIPIFSNFRGGLNVLIGGSGGFLIGFIIIATLISYLKNIKIINKQYWPNLIILFAMTIILYMIGGSYIAFITKTSLWLVLGGFYVYLFGDLIKIIIAFYVHVRVGSYVTYEPS